MTEDADEPEVLVARRGHLGHLTLNRPRALNALTHAMVTTIRQTLDAWEHDDAIRTVAITGSGDRALCAGGDIVALYRDATSGDHSAAERFWADEFRLNARIARYPKPYVAIMDGIVLGGGIGVSAHGSHRVVTERSSLGLPETGIGYVPDVGSTWLLSRAPGELGTSIALTAGSVGPGDALELGLADSFVPSDRIPELLAALQTESADAAMTRFAEAAPESPLAARRDAIDAAYAANEVAEILERLRAGDEASRAAAETIGTRSPTALAVTLESLRRARHLETLEDVLRQEFRVSLRILGAPDFAEGVRAQVIDKDRNPRWSPAGAGSVDRSATEPYFAPLERELTFP